MLGTNGGGFFNANSAHPYENPTPLSNFLEMLAILLIPARAVLHLRPHGRRHAPGLGGARRDDADVRRRSRSPRCIFEQQGNPLFAALGVDQAASATQSGGNMEGKETRFGIADSALFATITTAASNGAVNSMHDSFTPLGGLVPMLLMQLGEVVFGGVGSGLYGMLVFAILAVFIAGLMIGRTPEYLGKKIEAFEMKMASIAILVTPLLVLVGTAIAVMADAGRAGIANPGRARLLGDPLRLLLGRQQQRQRLRRPLGQHAVLQHAAGHRDVVRPLRRDRAGAGDRRLAGGQEAHRRPPAARCRRTARCSSCC